MPGVARVFVKVVPDMDDFKATVQAFMDRLERSTKLTVKLVADTHQASRDIDDVAKSRSSTVNADADTGKASLKLAEVSRSRSVSLSVDVKTASLAKAKTQLLALTGIRPVLDTLGDLGGAFQNIDRAAPKLAGAALAIGSIGSLAVSSGAGLLTMAGALSSLGGLALPLPGLLAAAGVAGVTLAVALAGAKTQLASLQPVWDSLKSTIQDNFWARAQQPILDLVNGVFPQLQAGLGAVSDALGTWAGSVASSFQTAFGGDVLTGLMGKLSQAIQNSTVGTAAFAQSIATLGTFSSQYLPGIGTMFSNLSISFNNWIGSVAANGQLEGWVQDAMATLSQLGAVVESVVSIFGSLLKAANIAGSSGLDTVATALGDIAGIVNGPAFQTALISVFQGAAAGASGLAAALGPIGSLIGALAPAISGALATLGQTAGELASGIAAALSDPTVGAGLTTAIQGIAAGVQGLLPALGPLATALGSVLSFIGPLAAVIGQALGAALAAVAPVITDVFNAIQPLIPIVGQLLMQAISSVVPVISALMAVFNALMPAVLPIITAFQPLVGALLPPLAALIQALVPIFTQFAGIIAQVANALAPIIASLMPPLIQLFSALTPIITALLQPFLALLTPILGLIAPLLQLIGPILAPLIDLLTVVANLVAGALAPIMQSLVPIFASVGQIISDVLLPVIQTITDVLGGLIDFLTGVFTGNWQQAWDGIVEIFTGIWNGLGNIVIGVINGMIDLINGLIDSVNSITGAIGIPAIPDIPHLATGGDVESRAGGTLVVLGEGGQAETVTNRGLTNRMLATTTALAQQALGSGSGSEIVVNNYGAPGQSEAELGRIVVNGLNFAQRVAG